MKLNYSYTTLVDQAYIITIKGNEKSERYSKRCQDSCDAVGQAWQIWDAYDGTGKGLIVPSHSASNAIMNMMKVTDNNMTLSELACALSHISLWSLCAELDKPIVILEHDAIMLRQFTEIGSLNSVIYLGCHEWYEKKSQMYSIPLMGIDGPNNHFLLRTHAYAIDPLVARNLIADVIKRGIWYTVDRMIQSNLYNITHQGMYAYDNRLAGDDTTIIGRTHPDNKKDA